MYLFGIMLTSQANIQAWLAIGLSVRLFYVCVSSQPLMSPDGGQHRFPQIYAVLISPGDGDL